ncbi:MAG: GNAT family N-acetyltransferase [Ruminococcaceae bacterium]|nr:GNAT family N-acetyltransferase [Oscillospiraceae bacterium]
MERVLTVCHGELPEAAMTLRVEVFVREQGFTDEFDEIDAIATHLVLHEGEMPIATCRIFREKDARPEAKGEDFLLGRLAVRFSRRGRGIGSMLLARAEEEARAQGGRTLALHAQCHAIPFYEKNGYSVVSDVEEEQGAPHVWMKKQL